MINYDLKTKQRLFAIKASSAETVCSTAWFPLFTRYDLIFESDELLIFMEVFKD